ncbi:MAG TPA: hypothetical protein VKW06_22450 [Candidatus Angelobacter sp.]|nr:hypothetical protein [Candidatus Angelobacter sp.]
MNSSVLKFALASTVLAAASCLPAQTSSQIGSDSDRGFTEIESVQSTLNSQERLFKVDSNVGWDFNRHFGVFGGVPLYFVNVPSSTVTTGGTTTTTPGTSHNGMGNAYLGFALRESGSKVDYAGVITLAAPTASTKDGLSTGRGTFDFDNRFQHAFKRFMPFFDGGIGNSVPDSILFSRPFTSLGFITHLEEGGGYSLTKRFSVNASAYEIVPAGNQKIYSKLVAQGQTGKAGSKNVFQTNAFASGSGLTRENGFNAWVQFEPAPAWDFAVGYTRSATYGLNSFAFNLRMNVGKLLRSGKIS